MFFTKWLRRKKPQVSEPKSVVVVKAKKIFVIDTNILMYGVDYLATLARTLDVKIVIPWAVVEEVIGFRRRSFRENSGLSREFIQSIRNIWSVLSQKIETGEWKLAGSEGRDFKEIFQKNGFTLGVEDVRILAATGILREQFEKVFLVTRDRKLREVAEELGIQTLGSLDDMRAEIEK